MAKFVAGRLVESIPVLVLASLLVFSILHLIPGDPIDAMLGSAAAGVGTPESRQQLTEQIREQLGLNDPLWLQYVRWLANAARLDLGESFIRHQPVAQLIATRLPSTLELAGAALLEVLGREYVRPATAKGLYRRTVVLRHAMRNALIPVVTVVGLQLGRLIAGSVIVETVFARQGIGQLAIDAILQKDYPVVQGVILLTATSYVFANLLVDVSYGFLNPRIRSA